MEMTEATLQFAIKTFVVLVAIIVAATVGVLIFIVGRDGNNPLVAESYNSLVGLTQWALGIIGAVIVGKPIASGIGNLLQGKAIQASTQNIPVTPQNIPVTPVASSESTISPPASLTPGTAL